MGKKRSRKFRGYRRHGHGMKGRRGKGLRGGKGMAGLCKHRFIWMVKYRPDHWGRHGFTSHHPRREVRAISIKKMHEMLPIWLENGYARREGDIVVVDLGAAGYQKLLGSGRVTTKLKVIVEDASERAVEKITAAGGEVEMHGRADTA
jgi:large subunit ribosomal protein L15